MKALEILKEINEGIKSSVDYNSFVGIHFNIDDQVRIEKAIKELEVYTINYQGINRRLDNTVTALSVLEHQNKSLVKTLEKYNEEMIVLRNENQDLLNTIIEAQKVIKNVLERNK